MRKYLVTLRRVLIGVSLSFLLGLSQAKAEVLEALILQGSATRIVAAAAIDTPSVEVDIAQIVQVKRNSSTRLKLWVLDTRLILVPRLQPGKDV